MRLTASRSDDDRLAAETRARRRRGLLIFFAGLVLFGLCGLLFGSPWSAPEATPPIDSFVLEITALLTSGGVSVVGIAVAEGVLPRRDERRHLRNRKRRRR